MSSAFVLSKAQEVAFVQEIENCNSEYNTKPRKFIITVRLTE